ncbi:MAG: hypothetical protein A2W91_00035 [Bacteroidetes bacterium GWF2_38_335]|nr:MAG: hypothetical protein A2W91_00035 [Bacteroidetes bacterium GWF2_38_335]OFY79710.1 MAG: hypothetical protein A2281_09630 [Bacteroidetes bacterium RIFOXYA12_FULL_38_20]HBS87585.1 phosphatase [Bacteroidales bacterium]
MTGRIEKIFTENGGRFLRSVDELSEKVNHVKAFLFDWDGVFNAGIKTQESGSPFSEVDSMGLNLIRLSYWLKNGKFPFVGIITGQNNPTAVHLAKREHFDAVYSGFLNKKDALEHLEKQYKITGKQIAFVYDDVLDLSIASKASLRFMPGRKSNPLFREFVKTNDLCDYISANDGGNHAIREISELVCAFMGNFEETIKCRIDFGEKYRKYLEGRNKTEVAFYSIREGKVVPEIK